MIKVRVTAKVGNVAIQDPRPQGVTNNLPTSWELNVNDASPTEMIMPFERYERISPILKSLGDSGVISYSVEGVGYTYPESAESIDTNSVAIEAVRGTITENTESSLVAEVAWLFGAPLTDGAVTERVQRYADVTVTSSSTGTISVKTTNTGYTQNDRYAVEVVNAGSGGFSVSIDDTDPAERVIVVELGGTTTAIATIATAINTALVADGDVFAFAVASGSGNGAVFAKTYLTGGRGEEFSFTAAGTACIVNSFSGNAPYVVTLTVPALGSAITMANGGAVNLEVTSAGRTSSILVPVSVTRHNVIAARVATVDVNASPAGTAVPLVVEDLSVASLVLLTSSSSTANLVRVNPIVAGAAGNVYTYKVVEAADDTLAVTYNNTAKTLTIALANSTASNNSVAAVASAIDTACAGYLVATAFGTGNVNTTNNPDEFTEITPASGGDYTVTAAGLACTGTDASKTIPLAATGNTYILTWTTPDMSSVATGTSFVNITVAANGHKSSVSVATAA